MKGLYRVYSDDCTYYNEDVIFVFNDDQFHDVEKHLKRTYRNVTDDLLIELLDGHTVNVLTMEDGLPQDINIGWVHTIEDYK